jgi:hypothetical protein
VGHRAESSPKEFNDATRPAAWIETIADDEAEGELADIYRRLGHPIAHILRSNSINPSALRTHYDLYRTLMFGPSPLTRVQREMIATVVSLLNHCHY